MQKIQVTAPAKINVSLDITGVRADGYHLLTTVMQSLSLADRLTLTASPSESETSISLSCDVENIPCGPANTAYKAAVLFCEKSGLQADLKIDISKRIPAAAGLAGGSANAAAVLFALSHLFPGRLKMRDLMEIAIKIGADVPFCLHGGTVLCEGIGEKLKPLPSFSGVPILLLNPGFPVSTAWAFKSYDTQPEPQSVDTGAVIKAMKDGRMDLLAESARNVLEPITLNAYPQLNAYKQMLIESGAQLVLMSGSGPTLYAIYPSVNHRDAAQADIKGRVPASVRLIASETRDAGPVIIK